MAAGWIAMGELQKQMEHLHNWGLLTAPFAKERLCSPKVVNLIQGQLNELAGFCSAEMLDRTAMEPTEPANEFSTAVAFNSAPVVARQHPGQTAHCSVAYQPNLCW
jgi:hypothetical protein